MEKLTIKWGLSDSGAPYGIERYCPNCGKRVWFVDSLKRRHNANGKNIYEYIIYKCERGHTWNQRIAVYKSQHDGNPTEMEKMNQEGLTKPEIVRLSLYREAGVREIEIRIEYVEERWRIDKLLADTLEGISRTKVKKYIKEGLIRINDQIIQPDYIVRENDRINLLNLLLLRAVRIAGAASFSISRVSGELVLSSIFRDNVSSVYRIGLSSSSIFFQERYSLYSKKSGVR